MSLHRPDVAPFSERLVIDSMHKLLTKNPCCLCVDIGKQVDKTLDESFVSFKCDEKATIDVWQAQIRKLKKATQGGAWVIDPSGEHRRFYKTARFTEGALKLFAMGVRLRDSGLNFVEPQPAESGAEGRARTTSVGSRAKRQR